VDEMETKETIFELSASDEEIIRTYECTKLRRFLAPVTTGYLTITNKRVVFHSTGKSLTGQSLLINDMPIEDTCGVSAYFGLSINWVGFLIFSIFLYFVTNFISMTLPAFFTSWIFAFLLMLPYLVILLLSGEILSSEMRSKLNQSIKDLSKNKIDVDKDADSYLPITRMIFYAGLAILSWALLFNSSIGAMFGPLQWILLGIAYFFIYMFFFGRHRAFSLMIASKTMKGSGIYIPGDSFRMFFLQNKSALETLSAGPSVDAEIVSRELGAMLLDIRQMGDLGIQKWKR
jgi:hypothetical protein